MEDIAADFDRRVDLALSEFKSELVDAASRIGHAIPYTAESVYMFEGCMVIEYVVGARSAEIRFTNGSEFTVTREHQEDDHNTDELDSVEAVVALVNEWLSVEEEEVKK